jgi:hypothetical protein
MALEDVVTPRVAGPARDSVTAEIDGFKKPVRSRTGGVRRQRPCCPPFPANIVWSS